MERGWPIAQIPSSERQLSTVTYRIVHAGHGQDHVPNPRQFELQYYWAVL